ncbi:luciferase domain-containing protein [Kyrpidia tusciae]|nr:luciferase family protein [Kyrpidia tusciae]
MRISKDLPPMLRELPPRPGRPPRIDVRYPCLQQEDVSPPNLREELLRRAAGLTGVEIRPTELSVPAMALVLDESLAEGQPEAFIRGREFALIRTDGSVHVPLMPEWGEPVLQKGWACIHPLVRYMAGVLPPQNLIAYAPRDERELETVWNIVQAGYCYARGWIVEPDQEGGHP